MNKRKIILKSLILVIWMSIIYFLSNQNGNESSNLSNGLLYNIFKTFHLSDTLVNDFLLNLIRKLAHFTEYLILGILVLNLLKEFNIKNKIFIGALLCLLYAASDEIHQLFINDRSASILDVLIDFLGSMTGLFLYNFKIKIKTKVS